MQEYDLDPPRRPVRIAIAAAEFNRFITDQLLEGAFSALESHGVSQDQRVLAWVPGAYELPLAADRLGGRLAGLGVRVALALHRRHGRGTGPDPCRLTRSRSEEVV